MSVFTQSSFHRSLMSVWAAVAAALQSCRGWELLSRRTCSWDTAAAGHAVPVLPKMGSGSLRALCESQEEQNWMLGWAEVVFFLVKTCKCGFSGWAAELGHLWARASPAGRQQWKGSDSFVLQVVFLTWCSFCYMYKKVLTFSDCECPWFSWGLRTSSTDDSLVFILTKRFPVTC